ncbi:MAG: hypothetical protein R3B90_19380 [Planctomycetaceae bacterium]
MSGLLGLGFAGASMLFWFYVWTSWRERCVKQVRRRVWWRETRYYSRDDEPVRYWFTMFIWSVFASISAVAAVKQFLKL